MPAGLVGLLVGLLGAAPVAADCRRPDLLATFPPQDASRVPLNARLSALYAINAEWLGEAVVLELPGGGELDLDASFDATRGLLSVVPPALMPESTYRIRWPGLRGVGSASLGQAATVTFTTGSTTDERSPRFEGLTGVDWDVEREGDACTDSLEQRFRFDLQVGIASDDAGPELLALTVFQTRGPGLQAPEPVLFGPLPAPGERVSLRRTLGAGGGEVCFAALVTDLTERASPSSAERCTRTVKPPFFEGCSTSAPATPEARAGWLAAVAALTAGGRLRRRRREVAGAR